MIIIGEFLQCENSVSSEPPTNCFLVFLIIKNQLFLCVCSLYYCTSLVKSAFSGLSNARIFWLSFSVLIWWYSVARLWLQWCTASFVEIIRIGVETMQPLNRRCSMGISSHWCRKCIQSAHAEPPTLCGAQSWFIFSIKENCHSLPSADLKRGNFAHYWIF